MRLRSRDFQQKGAFTALLLGSWILFLVGIQFPQTPNFDEFHYVPAAKRILARTENTNWEHPPLGKLLIAGGILVGGDRPMGWRLASTLSGVATLGGVVFLAQALGMTPWIALGIGVLTLLNGWVYVQARIGMLDTPMCAFLIWGLFFWIRSARDGVSRKIMQREVALAGVFFGLAAACKWFGWVVLAWAVASLCIIWLFRAWRVRFESPQARDWYSPQMWKGVRFYQLASPLILSALLVYFLTFLPLWGMPGGWKTPLDLVIAQKTMYEGQLRVVTSHPYMSTWSQWWLPSRPIWYAFERDGAQQEWIRGVFLIGNPWIQWLGLVALLWGVVQLIQTRDRSWMWVISAFCTFYFSYLLIPRKVFFYFYYYPASLLLPIALGLVLRDWKTQLRWTLRAQQMAWGICLSGALSLFIYFFPILSAQRIPADSFRMWMWFSGWI